MRHRLGNVDGGRAREWIAQPSTGSLPARRLAARLIERAAREAATRAQQGDDHPMRAFKSEAVRESWIRLLDDRESLVWRHVAVARGLIAPWMPEAKGEISGALGAALTPTEWRRGATSIAAMIAVSPDAALKLAETGIAGGVIKRDPGVAAAFIWGLARAAEAESEAASKLLDQVVKAAPIDSAEALAELVFELEKAPFVDRAARNVLGEIRKTERSGDDGKEALMREIASDLARETREDPPVRVQLAA
ncbi:MAG: serine/threonine protein kinase, partial [Polyangiaceae bacterium]